MIYVNNYLWLIWLLVIIKWLIVIILLWNVSVVCINVVAGLLFFVYSWLLIIICDVVYITADIGQLFFEKYLEKLIGLI